LCFKPDVDSEENAELIPMAGNDQLAADEAATSAQTNAHAQQVRLVRETQLVYSVSL